MITLERRTELLGRYPHLKEYHITVLDLLRASAETMGRSVLEVGGNNYPAEILLGDLGASRWVSVNRDIFALTPGESAIPLSQAETHFPFTGRLIFQGCAEDLPALFDGQFDVVFSVAAFEHVLQLPRVLRRICAALRPGGKFFSHFAPIWSARLGHHLWLDDQRFNFTVPDILPDYCHLLMSPPELHDWCVGRYGEEKTCQIVHQIFHSIHVNRLWYRDYLAYMTKSPFASWSARPAWNDAVSEENAARLAKRFPGVETSDFGVGGLIIEAAV